MVHQQNEHKDSETRLQLRIPTAQVETIKGSGISVNTFVKEAVSYKLSIEEKGVDLGRSIDRLIELFRVSKSVEMCNRWMEEISPIIRRLEYQFPYLLEIEDKINLAEVFKKELSEQLERSSLDDKKKSAELRVELYRLGNEIETFTYYIQHDLCNPDVKELFRHPIHRIIKRVLVPLNEITEKKRGHVVWNVKNFLEVWGR